MGIRRTKEYKQQVQLKVAQHLYQYQAATQTVAHAGRSPVQLEVHHDARDLFAYDVKLIYRDLLKTLIITVLIICVLVALTFYFKH